MLSGRYVNYCYFSAIADCIKFEEGHTIQDEVLYCSFKSNERFNEILSGIKPKSESLVYAKNLFSIVAQLI
jgi:hypothetical protein